MPVPGIETITTALVGIGGAAYLVIRKLKSDKTSDTIAENAVSLSEKVDARTQTLIDNLQQEVQSKNDQNKHLSEVIERVASERNEAVQLVGELKATVGSLSERVMEMRNEMEKLEKENSNLASQVAQMTKDLKDLGLRMVDLALKNQELVTALQARLNTSNGVL